MGPMVMPKVMMIIDTAFYTSYDSGSHSLMMLKFYDPKLI